MTEAAKGGGLAIPRASLIIATVDRPRELAELLDSLARSTALPIELIVIDQSRNDTTEQVVKTRWSRAPLVYLRDPSIYGACEARNLGIGQARGEIVVFLDDDVVVEPDFLEQLLSTFVEYPEAAAVSGVITNYRRPPWPARLRNRLLYWGPFHDDRQPAYFEAAALRGRQPFPVTRLGSGLIAVQRPLLEEIRFDTAFGRYPLGEDIDFSFRLAAKGPLLMNPSARLVHVRAPGLRSAIARPIRELHSWALLYARHFRRGLGNRMAFAVLACGLLCEGAGMALRRRSGALLGDVGIAFARAITGRPSTATLGEEKVDGQARLPSEGGFRA